MKKTRYLKVDPQHPQQEIITLAAEYIQAGELVAFPTETVYGLGADAFQPAAVEKIFLAKGRPPQNPLLVHISSLSQVGLVAAEINPRAEKLMHRFWPGPLSIILPARPEVPAIVRGGQRGVGLRMPDHPVALALIEAAGPLAAPSANLYGRPSPTNAEHVRHDLDGRIALVLDAGATGTGLESTLIDVSGPMARVLRLGGITIEELEECLEEKLALMMEEGPAYAISVRVILSEDQEDFTAKQKEMVSQGVSWGLVGCEDVPLAPEAERIFRLQSGPRGSNLYAIVREAEQAGIKTLLFVPLDPQRVGKAIMDRLRRASGTGLE